MSTIPSNNTSLYANLENWTKMHEINLSKTHYMQTYTESQAELNTNIFNSTGEQKDYDLAQYWQTEAKEEVQSDYEAMKQTIGQEFDFMEGHDVSNSQEYDAQVLKLAQGEIEEKDIDNDGKLSAEEYALSEVLDMIKIPEVSAAIDLNADGKIDEDEIQAQKDSDEKYNEKLQLETAIASLYFFEILNQNLETSDKDGYLSDTELAEFYTHLDEFQGGDGVTLRDGKIDIDLAAQYPQFLIDQIDNPTFLSDEW